jgi:hypothetical protein
VTKQKLPEFWEAILKELDEKLQYGMLEQTSSIVSVTTQGPELILKVNSAEAYEYFMSDVNQRRLCIYSRSVINIERISVELIIPD